MATSVQGKLRAPVTALILFGAMSGPAFAATDGDSAKAFIASLAGKREPTARDVIIPSLNQPQEDPARLFISGLEGKHERPSRAVSTEVDTHPDRDFINRLSGRPL